MSRDGRFYMLAISKLRISEGGYVNHPRDPGGATNHGVTEAIYDAHRKRLGLAARTVKSITEAEMGAIYHTQDADKIAGFLALAALAVAAYWRIHASGTADADADCIIEENAARREREKIDDEIGAMAPDRLRDEFGRWVRN